MRRTIEGIELCDVHEHCLDFGEKTWEGECSYDDVEGVQQEGIAISAEEKRLRGFHDLRMFSVKHLHIWTETLC